MHAIGERGLGCNAELREDRNAGAGDRPNRIGEIGGAIELDDVRACLFDQADGGLDRGVRPFLQRAEGEIAGDERVAGAAPHGFADEDHLFHGDFQRRRVAPQIDAHSVANGDDLDAGSIDDLRDLIIPGNDADDLARLALHLLQRRYGDFGVGGIRAHCKPFAAGTGGIGARIAPDKRGQSTFFSYGIVYVARGRDDPPGATRGAMR